MDVGAATDACYDDPVAANPKTHSLLVIPTRTLEMLVGIDALVTVTAVGGKGAGSRVTKEPLVFWHILSLVGYTSFTMWDSVAAVNPREQPLEIVPH